jgi:hypothetical protein
MTHPLPNRPLSWEQNPMVVNISRRILQLEMFTRRSFYGNDNWREKETSLGELENLKKRKNVIVQKAKEQYQVELIEYDELLKAYEHEQEILKAEEEKRKKKCSHPILGLDIK